MENNTLNPLFFADTSFAENDVILIEGEEAVHMVNSRRLREKDTLALTNGRGSLAMATVSAVDVKRHLVSVRIVKCDKVDFPLVKIALASAIPKGDRQATLLNMATQLGMNQYIPLLCEHSVVKYQPKFHPRWHKVTMNACKQSRRCHFPSISEEMTFSELVVSQSIRRKIVVGDISGGSMFDVKKSIESGIEEIVLVIGPEGGFSFKEMQLFEQQNVLKLSLSCQILRTEAAAVALIAVVNQMLNSFT